MIFQCLNSKRFHSIKKKKKKINRKKNYLSTKKSYKYLLEVERKLHNLSKNILEIIRHQIHT